MYSLIIAMCNMFETYFSSVSIQLPDQHAYDIFPNQLRRISSSSYNLSTLTTSQNSVLQKLQTMDVTKGAGDDDKSSFFL